MIEQLSEEDNKKIDVWKKGDRSELKFILFIAGMVIFVVLVAGSKWLVDGFSYRVKVGVLYVPIMSITFLIFYYLKKCWYYGLPLFGNSPESPELTAYKEKVDIDIDRNFKMVDKVFILSKTRKKGRYSIRFTNGLVLEDSWLSTYNILLDDLTNKTPLEIEYLPKSKHILNIRKL
ncbi:MAG: hypothetical protein EAZ08_03385 [Cytophagales bacterium]|nr:MAG: hypothetical protein EAZ08_03385 [Cytophagales bacterium]